MSDAGASASLVPSAMMVTPALAKRSACDAQWIIASSAIWASPFKYVAHVTRRAVHSKNLLEILLIQNNFVIYVRAKFFGPLNIYIKSIDRIIFS
jgi:hypothetical protein